MIEKLEEIIELIREHDDEKQSYVYVDQNDDGSIKISGNPQGLRLLAATLIYESLNVQVPLPETGSSVPFADMRVEAVNLPQEEFKTRQQRIAMMETKGSGLGCVLFIFAIVALLVMGIIFLFRLF
jgi:hypothetical protein